MNEQRPDPDELLRRIRERGGARAPRQAQDLLRRRGRRRQDLRDAGRGRTSGAGPGVDVVVGVVETHGRAETAALLEGLELLPPRAVEYRGATLAEFDLDAALARRPGAAAASTSWPTPTPPAPATPSAGRTSRSCSPPASTSTRRSTSSTSRASTTSSRRSPAWPCARRCPTRSSSAPTRSSWSTCRPTSCSSACARARSTSPSRRARAAEHFFRKGNLIALRELALRRTAERVDAQMQSYRREHAIRDTWPVGERILVCVGRSAARGAPGARRAPHGGAAEAPSGSRCTSRPRASSRRPGAARDHLVDLMGSPRSWAPRRRC